jgi:hypothetical protein
MYVFFNNYLDTNFRTLYTECRLYLGISHNRHVGTVSIRKENVRRVLRSTRLLLVAYLRMIFDVSVLI